MSTLDHLLGQLNGWMIVAIVAIACGYAAACRWARAWEFRRLRKSDTEILNEALKGATKGMSQ